MANKRYYIKFSGSAFGIEADTPENAWKQIRDALWCYCTPDIREIGVEVDELGYPIKKKLTKELGLE